MQSIAQTPKPVKVTAKVIAKNATDRQVQLHINLESSWHIFSDSAGGDGLAINTEIVAKYFNKNNKVINAATITNKNASMQPMHLEMEGFGIMNIFDKPFYYTLPQVPADAKSISIEMTYQACNNQMCLPPVVEKIKVDL